MAASAAVGSVGVLGHTDGWSASWAVFAEAVNLITANLVKLEEGKLVLLLHVWLSLWGLLGLLLSLLILTGTVDWGDGNEGAVLWNNGDNFGVLEELTSEEEGDDVHHLGEVFDEHGWGD